ncbi:MAG: hypothetical protein JNM21_12320, partial [Taibaiella sp.]|nr:hypothetical protein [Taibaiella sp.]
NYGAPNAGVAYIEGQMVVLGGTKTFNFEGDYASHQAWHAAFIKEQAGEYEKASSEGSGYGEMKSGYGQTKVRGNRNYVDTDGTIVVVGKKKCGIFGRVLNWFKRLNFHFEFGIDLSFGAQVGISGDVSLGSKRLAPAGGDINAASFELASGKVEVDVNDNSVSGKPTGDYYGKDGKVKWKQSVSGGVGIVGGSAEREFYAGGDDPEIKNTFKGSVGPFSSEYSPNTIKGVNSSGIYLDAGVNVRLLFGISITTKIGFNRKK